MEKWERITSKEEEGYYSTFTERLKVFDGWIVRSTDSNHRNQCMVFVPDMDHDWVIEPDPKPEPEPEPVVEEGEREETRGALGSYRG